MKLKLKAFARFISIVLTVLNPFRFKKVFTVLLELEKCRDEFDALSNQNALISDLEKQRKHLLEAEADLQFNLENCLKLN